MTQHDHWWRNLRATLLASENQVICVMGKTSRRTANYKLKMKRQKGLGHAKSRLRDVLAKTTSDFHHEKEEKEQQIQSLKK